MVSPAAPGVSARRFSIAQIVWLAFVIVQALDGVMSYIGVYTFGSWIEANPLVAWYAATFGPGVAFTAAKLFAVACGLVLYTASRHRLVAFLTIVYLIFAVGPWVHVLTSFNNVQ